MIKAYQQPLIDTFSGAKELPAAADTILVVLGAQQVCLALQQGSTRKILGVQYYRHASRVLTPDLLMSLVAGNKFFRKPLAKVRVAWEGPVHMLVPAGLQEAGEPSEWSELQYQLLPDQAVLASRQEATDALSVFALPISWKKAIYKLWPAAEIVHSSAPLLDALAGAENSAAHIFHVELKDKSMLVTLFANNQLQLQQSYEAPYAADFLNTLLQLCKEFKVNFEQCAFILSGNSYAAGMLQKDLQQYCSQVKQAAFLKDVAYPPLLNLFPAHYFLNLFSLAVCAS
jgi:hypothetical protein